MKATLATSTSVVIHITPCIYTDFVSHVSASGFLKTSVQLHRAEGPAVSTTNFGFLAILEGLMEAFCSWIPVNPHLNQLSALRASAVSTKVCKYTKRVRGAPVASSSKDGNSEETASWQQEIRLLLNPNITTGAKQVLLQDLAKRTPEIIEDSCSMARSNPNMRGILDVLRQVTEDIVPDLVLNGPRYFARAVQEFPDGVTRQAKDSNSLRNSMPRPTAEELQQEFRNVFNRTPEGLFTPQYETLCSYDGFEIRKYPTLIVATSAMSPNKIGADITEVESAAAMGQAFNTLAGYLFGKNESKTAMKMTTPVVLDKGAPNEKMSFIIGEYNSVGDVPNTLDDSVVLREEEGKIYAVLEFSGYVTQGEAKRQREKLLSLLARNGVQTTDDGRDTYKCMIYNGPSTLPNLRRNEMMIEVVCPEDEAQ